MKSAAGAAAHVGMAAMLALSCLSADGRFAGAAAGACLLARLNKSNRARIAGAALLLAAAALTPWGALAAVCILNGLLLTAAWLAESGAVRLARLSALALAVKLALFVIVPDISPHMQRLSGAAPLTAALAALAFGAETAALRRRQPAEPIDPLLAALLTAIFCAHFLMLALLSVSIAYPKAILLATAGIGALLTAAALLTAPFTAAGADAPPAAQYAFSLRAPVERWVSRISALAERKQAAREFAAAVMEEFASLPGVVGVEGRMDGNPLPAIGERRRHVIELRCPPLHVRLQARRRASPWEWFNYHLLARIAAEYCLAKQREERNRADNLSRAVHETGARLTHDIKNILHALAALMQSPNDALIRRQLPLLRERLQSALGKLRTPTADDGRQRQKAADWLREARQRYAHRQVAFGGEATGTLPTALFDLALDNFIGNALVKQQASPDLTISAVLTDGDNGPELRVDDDGAAVSATTATALFSAPVVSQTGFGVALYQVGLEAAKRDHVAKLENNEDGRVVFALCPNAPTTGAATG